MTQPLWASAKPRKKIRPLIIAPVNLLKNLNNSKKIQSIMMVIVGVFGASSLLTRRHQLNKNQMPAVEKITRIIKAIIITITLSKKIKVNNKTRKNN